MDKIKTTLNEKIFNSNHKDIINIYFLFFLNLYLQKINVNVGILYSAFITHCYFINTFNAM